MWMKCLDEIINPWLLRYVDKRVYYGWSYKGNVLQPRIDEEGSGAVFAAAKLQGDERVTQSLQESCS